MHCQPTNSIVWLQVSGTSRETATIFEAMSTTATNTVVQSVQESLVDRATKIRSVRAMLQVIICQSIVPIINRSLIHLIFPVPSQSSNTDEDELLTVNINLTRVKHENKQLANALADTKAELASVRAELNRLKRWASHGGLYDHHVCTLYYMTDSWQKGATPYANEIITSIPNFVKSINSLKYGFHRGFCM